ncbi:MAG: YmdB family metallophosphoesterase [Spirochaetaceae bacterium]|nr:MAG: YmdB family metallophosphoesterase [Spirochaetaceae bacterium]
MNLRVLFVGEIVGRAGVYCIKSVLSEVKKRHAIDFVVANGDGTTGGFGIGKNHSIYLRKLGVDAITGGDQVYYKKDMVEHIENAYYILRPANFPPGNPGRGWRYFTVRERKIGVISMLGQSGFDRVHLSNPFTFLPEIVERLKRETQTVIVDFHAVTTAEKYSMFHLADGMVSALIGTGQRVMTSDARISVHGTATICDAGRTGSIDSVAGLDPAVEIRQFVTQMPERSQDSWASPALQGVVIEIDAEGRAQSIETVNQPCTVPANETQRNGDPS